MSYGYSGVGMETASVLRERDQAMQQRMAVPIQPPPTYGPGISRLHDVSMALQELSANLNRLAQEPAAGVGPPAAANGSTGGPTPAVSPLGELGAQLMAQVVALRMEVEDLTARV